MAVSKAEKETELKQLELAFRGTENVILLDYKGLDVPQVTELRRHVQAVQAQYRVVKNTLAKRALKGTAAELLSEHFKGTTAVAYSSEDPVALAKALISFSKTVPALTVKAAIVQGRTVPAAAVAELAALPSKPELFAILLRQLQASMVQLVNVLNALPRDIVNVLVQVEQKKTAD